MSATLPILNQQADFPQLAQKINGYPFTYFDTAATSLKPKEMVDAISHFYSFEYGTVHRAAYTSSTQATQKYTQAREQIQRFIGACFPEEVLFTKGTTASINLLAHTLGASLLKEGKCVLVSEVEHHSNLIPWHLACKNSGAQLKKIRVNDTGELDLEHLKQLLKEGNVSLVALAHVSNVTGVVHPIQEIAAMVHKAGALLSVDGAQAVGHLSIDVVDLDVDFYQFSSHKVYGPTGLGVLYGKKEKLSFLPVFEGGGDMVEQWDERHPVYQALPLKFEAGTPPIAEVIGFAAALEYLSKITLKVIQEHELRMMEHLLEIIQRYPKLRIIGGRTSKRHLLTLTSESWHPLDLAMLLDSRGIAVRSGHLCSQPSLKRFNCSSFLRFSLGVSNTLSDLEHLEKALDALSKFL